MEPVFVCRLGLPTFFRHPRHKVPKLRFKTEDREEMAATTTIKNVTVPCESCNGRKTTLAHATLHRLLPAHLEAVQQLYLGLADRMTMEAINNPKSNIHQNICDQINRVFISQLYIFRKMGAKSRALTPGMFTQEDVSTTEQLVSQATSESKLHANEQDDVVEFHVRLPPADKQEKEEAPPAAPAKPVKKITLTRKQKKDVMSDD
jgi:hypothetical protein